MRSHKDVRWGPILGVLAGLASLWGLWWFFVAFWGDGDDRFYKWFFQVWLERYFFPGGINPLHFTWFFWLCLAIVATIVALMATAKPKSRPAVSRRPSWDVTPDEPEGESTDKSQLVRTAGSVSWCVAVVSALLFVVVACFNINDHSGSYAGSTTFVVEDTSKIPPSLKRLADDTSPDKNGCALYAHNNMRGCINQGAFTFEWNSRVASATGARIVLSRSSPGVSNTTVIDDSLTYLYDEDGKGTWTIIRDGKKSQPVYGVASWSGEGNVETCTFKGQYSMNKAFAGRWGHNLADDIADRFPTLFYNSDDRYGYCEGDQPIIVIPVKEQDPYKTRTTFRSSGVLKVTGSPSGKPQYEHLTSVKPGDFPGPVYPSSLAKEQREAMGMIAGIKDSMFGNFGYEETDVATQSGNASEYQLRDKATGRIYWVTPMKPRGSDDQVLAAYALIPADEATQGSLNKQDIYVLPEGDPRAVNLDDLEARTRNALSRADNGFYQSGGSLAEFLPLNGKEWQVYAELGGRVVYRIEVSSDSRVRPKVIDLDNATSTPTSPAAGGGATNEPVKASACVEDPSTLSDQDLAQCLTDLAEELKQRQRPKSATDDGE